jgi:hypothetical protein
LDFTQFSSSVQIADHSPEIRIAVRDGPLLAEITTFKEILPILMKLFGQFEVPRERTKSLQ